MNAGQRGYQQWHNELGNKPGNIPKMEFNQLVDCIKYAEILL